MRSVGNVAEIGLVVLIERSGHANDDSVHLLDVRVIGGGGKTFGLRLLDFLRGDAVDVGFAFGQGIDLALINVEAGDGKFLVGEQQGQRQSYIAQADNSYTGLALLDLILGGIDRASGGGMSAHCCDRNPRSGYLLRISASGEFRFDSSM